VKQADGLAIGGALADPDGDDIPNLVEFGRGLDPLTPSINGLPVASLTNGQWTVAFTRNPAATDLIYTVQVSADLVTWADGSTYSSAAQHAEHRRHERHHSQGLSRRLHGRARQ